MVDTFFPQCLAEYYPVVSFVSSEVAQVTHHNAGDMLSCVSCPLVVVKVLCSAVNGVIGRGALTMELLLAVGGFLISFIVATAVS